MPHLWDRKVNSDTRRGGCLQVQLFQWDGAFHTPPLWAGKSARSLWVPITACTFVTMLLIIIIIILTITVSKGHRLSHAAGLNLAFTYSATLPLRKQHTRTDAPCHTRLLLNLLSYQFCKMPPTASRSRASMRFQQWCGELGYWLNSSWRTRASPSHLLK